MSNSYTFPPSPVAPWSRPTLSPVNHTLIEDGAVSLNTQITFLNSTTPKDAVESVVPPHLATLADGSWVGQKKVIQIPAVSVADTVVWRVNGTFIGFVALQLDALGQTAEVLWSEGGWSWLGGNAEKLDA